MIKGLSPLLAASFLSVSWASGAQAAPGDKGDTAAPAVNVVALASAAQTSSKPKPSKGLCDRLGGVFGIAAVVNRFSDAIIVNPALNQNPALVA
jgi:hypothetical protein